MSEPDPKYSKRYQELMRNAGEQRRLLLARIEQELAFLEVKRDAENDTEERILLKSEIAHLRALKANLGRRPKRKPPEAGIAVPAVPPKGPLPREGGAEAPLDFG